MHWHQILWLPSALLAWPLARYFQSEAVFGTGVSWIVPAINIGHDGVGGTNWFGRHSFIGMDIGDDAIRQLVFSGAALLLACVISGSAHRACVRNATFEDRSEILPTGLVAGLVGGFHKLSSDALCWKFGWLVLQPFLLMLIGWPAAISILGSSVYESSTLLLGAAIPTLVFDLFVRPIDGRGRPIKGVAMGYFPVVALVSVAVIAETTMLLNAWLESTPAKQVDMEGSGKLPNADFFGLVLAMLIAGSLTMMIVPFWMAWATEAGELEDERRLHWDNLWSKLQMNAPKMFFWPTNHRYVNAVVVSGLLTRRVFLTDRLLSQYSCEEIDLVLMHEIAHVVRRHYLLRMLPVLLTVPIILFVLQSFQGVLLVLACCLVLSMFLGLILVTCRWTELDADRQAIRLAGKLLAMNESQARKNLADVLKRIYADNKIDRTSWSHPTLAQRVNALE